MCKMIAANIKSNIEEINTRVDEGAVKFANAKPGTELEDAAFEYVTALESLNFATGHAMTYLEVTKKSSDRERKAYISSTVEQVAKHTAQLFNVLESLTTKALQSDIPSNSISLSAAIKNISVKYQHDYKESYGVGFWRKVKEFFKNPDREHEISFLKAVSSVEDCSDEIRLHAISLVQAKIASTEYFASGSKLREHLERLLSKTQITDANLSKPISLKDFCDKNNIEMPQKLQTYLNEHQADFTTTSLQQV